LRPVTGRVKRVSHPVVGNTTCPAWTSWTTTPRTHRRRHRPL